MSTRLVLLVTYTVSPAERDPPLLWVGRSRAPRNRIRGRARLQGLPQAPAVLRFLPQAVLLRSLLGRPALRVCSRSGLRPGHSLIPPSLTRGAVCLSQLLRGLPQQVQVPSITRPPTVGKRRDTNRPQSVIRKEKRRGRGEGQESREVYFRCRRPSSGKARESHFSPRAQEAIAEREAGGERAGRPAAGTRSEGCKEGEEP